LEKLKKQIHDNGKAIIKEAIMQNYKLRVITVRSDNDSHSPE
jgi:hypothetical protein